MKVKICVLLGQLLGYFVIGQTDGCNIILQALDHEVLRKEFLIGSFPDTILVYKEVANDLDCPTMKSVGKTIILSTNQIYKLVLTNEKEKHPWLLSLYAFKKLGKKRIISFWRPYSGAAVTLTFKQVRGKYKCVEYAVGSF